QILLEMQELVAVTEPGVKQNGSRDAKGGEEKRSRTGVVPAKDEQPAAQFERNGERQQLGGDAEHLHIGKRRRIGGKLAKGFVQEWRREQEAAGRRGRGGHGQLHRPPQFTLAEAIASSRSNISSHPTGQSFFSRARFSRALSTCPVST